MQKLSAEPIAEKQTCSLRVGAAYFIRTVTYHYTGRIARISDYDIELQDAAWIADSGRFNAALTTGELNEVEPFPDSVVIARTAIVDATVWNHDLPREVK